MVVSNGFRRLVHRHVLRFLSSRVLLHNASASTIETVIFRGSRSFGSNITHKNEVFSNSGKVYKEMQCLLGTGLSISKGRSIHQTAYSAGNDYYDTLAVSKEATTSEIKKAFYGLAKNLHPDTNKDDPEAADKFLHVQKAYDVLKYENKRAQYDRLGHDAFEGNQVPFDPIHIIRNMGGKDVKVTLELSFMEAVEGCSKTLNIQTDVSCNTCEGTGVSPL